MTDPDPRALRRRRGVVRASLTRLTTRLRELEATADQPTTLKLAQQMSKKLETLESDFKFHHFALIDITDVDETLAKEQQVLDEMDDDIADFTVRLRELITTCTASSGSSPRMIAARRLRHASTSLSSIEDAISTSTGPLEAEEVCLLHHQGEQLSDIKKELADIRKSLVTLGLEDTDDLFTSQVSAERVMSGCSLNIKKLLHSTRASSDSDSKGVRLPKLDIPTFDGDILHWQSFWEQFSVAVDDRTNISDTEKLVYLQQSLKKGPGKQVIEGLSRSGEHYAEAIACLKSRFNRPRLIHQAHVRAILETPRLKDGSGKELRHLHDIAQQHLRALKTMSYEPSGHFITSMLELKLDISTMFEWQKHSQEVSTVPHYQDLLTFINLRAQASETSVSDQGRKASKNDVYTTRRSVMPSKSVASFTASATDSHCVLCKTDTHPLYMCTKFKNLPHEEMLSTLKTNNLCMNCLRPGHFLKQCKSAHRCRRCQKPHHTLLHLETRVEPALAPATSVTSHTAMSLKSDSLLMTCRVLVDAPDGTSVEARALLDSASSVSFVTERLCQSLCLPRSHHNARISGIAGITHNSPTQSIATFDVSAVQSSGKRVSVTAVVVPRVTCDLPLHPIPFNSEWNHLSDIPLADPSFGSPGRIDILLGVDIFVKVLLHGRRIGLPSSPVAFETLFGWVLAGGTDSCAPTSHVAALHALLSGDDLLRKFWEVEECPAGAPILSPEERSVVHHFKTNHSRNVKGMFVVPLPRKPDVKPLGESRTQAVKRFLSLERSLRLRGQFDDVDAVMQEYFEMKHAELVPVADLGKPRESVFYLPMHVVRKESSSTTKIRAVFDASAKSSSGVSLNDTLLVGPTVHSSLIDVLLRFRFHRVALTTDVSRMYRAVELVKSDRDLHRFVWRKNPDAPLQDCRMTRVTFGVSASSFTANMSVKQNSLDFALDYPLAVKAVDESFYVDDGLTGADSVEEAVELQGQLQNLFARGGFLLRKWNSSEQSVLRHISPDLRDSHSMHLIPDPDEYTKTLGIAWNATMDHFRLTVAELPPLETVTKRVLVSDVAKTFDVLGWFSPSTIKVKILLQRLWECKVDWDDPVPLPILDAWSQWRSELKLLSTKHIPRCYHPKGVQAVSMQLHGFSDASEDAYAGVVYIRIVDSFGDVHISLVTSKTKVAPIRRLSIPRLELCGAYLLADLLHHVKEVFHLPLCDVHAWTDSTIVLSWLVGNPRRFKTYVGNRISCIVEQIAPDRWNHVAGVENPADCASRGVFPSELLCHELWWNGPKWLHMDSTHWPMRHDLPPAEPSDEERDISLHTTIQPRLPITLLNRYSSFTRLKRVSAWIFRFIHNARAHSKSQVDLLITHPCLTVREMVESKTYWMSISQEEHFPKEIEALKNDQALPSTSCLLSLHPFLDSLGLLRVGGRVHNSKLAYASQHPVILHGKDPVAKLLIHSEHLRLLHAGPTLLISSLSRSFHIIGFRKTVRSITRKCVTCRRDSVKPQPQMLGQLPIERVTPGPVFDKVGVDYAGPVYIKYGFVRKPTIVKAYICVFVSLSVKAVHLELVTDLTSAAFIATLRRFIARRGMPSHIWSDHGTNFVGAAREIKEFVEFLGQQQIQGIISDFCSTQNIVWQFIPERAPHFGGLWEAAVKSVKTHLKRVIADTKLTFEEFTTVLTQVEACLNSRPLAPLPCDDDGIEALTPAHFLIGRPLASIPDPSFSYRSISLLRRWHLCQALVRHFWQRWSTEYLSIHKRFTKWHHPTRNVQVGDVVLLQEGGLIPTKWPLARVTQVHKGKDDLVRVVTIKTNTGSYKRPVTKVALLLPSEN